MTTWDSTGKYMPRGSEALHAAGYTNLPSESRLDEISQWMSGRPEQYQPFANVGERDAWVAQYEEKQQPSLAMKAVMEQFGGDMGAYNQWFNAKPPSLQKRLGSWPKALEQLKRERAGQEEELVGPPTELLGPAGPMVERLGPEDLLPKTRVTDVTPSRGTTQYGPGLTSPARVLRGSRQARGLPPREVTPGPEGPQKWALGGRRDDFGRAGMYTEGRFEFPQAPPEPGLLPLGGGGAPPPEPALVPLPLPAGQPPGGAPPPEPALVPLPQRTVLDFPEDIVEGRLQAAPEPSLLPLAGGGYPTTPWIQEGIAGVPAGGVPLGDVSPREPAAAAPQRQLRGQFESAWPQEMDFSGMGAGISPMTVGGGAQPAPYDITQAPAWIQEGVAASGYDIGGAPSWIQEGVAQASPYNIGEAPEWIRQGVAGTSAPLGLLEAEDMAYRDNPVKSQGIADSMAMRELPQSTMVPKTLAEINEGPYGAPSGVARPLRQLGQHGAPGPWAPDRGQRQPRINQQDLYNSLMGYPSPGGGGMNFQGPPQMQVGQPYGFQSNAPMGPPQMQVGQPYGFQSSAPMGPPQMQVGDPYGFQSAPASGSLQTLSQKEMLRKRRANEKFSRISRGR